MTVSTQKQLLDKHLARFFLKELDVETLDVSPIQYIYLTLTGDKYKIAKNSDPHF